MPRDITGSLLKEQWPGLSPLLSLGQAWHTLLLATPVATHLEAPRGPVMSKSSTGVRPCSGKRLTVLSERMRWRSEMKGLVLWLLMASACLAAGVCFEFSGIGALDGLAFIGVLLFVLTGALFTLVAREVCKGP